MQSPRRRTADAFPFCGRDELGDRDAIETHLAERLDRPEVTVERFEPDRSLPERLQGGAAGLAYAFGAGVANVVTGDGPELR